MSQTLILKSQYMEKVGDTREVAGEGESPLKKQEGRTQGTGIGFFPRGVKRK